MYARIVTVQTQLDKVDQAIALFRESVVPANRQQKGFIGIRLFADGKWAEDWRNHDTPGMLQQLGVVPANGEQRPDPTPSLATTSCQRRRG